MDKVVELKRDANLFDICSKSKSYLLISITEGGDMETAFRMEDITNGEMASFYAIIGAVGAFFENVMLEEMQL